MVPTPNLQQQQQQQLLHELPSGSESPQLLLLSLLQMQPMLASAAQPLLQPLALPAQRPRVARQQQQRQQQQSRPQLDTGTLALAARRTKRCCWKQQWAL
jgi:hypothetical protein